VSLNRSAEPIREGHATLANDYLADTSRGDSRVSPAVLTIELRKEFRTTTALGGLSMTVGRGEVFGFLGPNGAGKTTAVQAPARSRSALRRRGDGARRSGG